MTERRLVIGSTIHGHDSAVFIIDVSTKEVYAMPTERLTRYKHDPSFAFPALLRCIEYAGIDPSTVTHVGFALSFNNDFKQEGFSEWHYEMEAAFRKHFGAMYKKDVDARWKAFQAQSDIAKFISLLKTPYGWMILADKVLMRLGIRKHLPLDVFVRRHLSKIFTSAVIETQYYDHEYCHVASSYIASPFEEALHCSFDGWGDGSFSYLYLAKGGTFQKIASSPGIPMKDLYNMGSEKEPLLMYPSVGGIYSYFTGRLGFTPIADEGKVEALAAYAAPDETLVTRLVDLFSFDAEALTLSLDPDKAHTLLSSERFEKLLSLHGKEVLAASVQAFLEQITHTYLSAAVKKTGARAVALSGGVSANVINNLAIFERITNQIFIMPAMADDGAAEGAAYAYLLEKGHTRTDLEYLRLAMPYRGTSYTKEEVSAFLSNTRGISYRDLGDTWPEQVGDFVAEGKIGAIFQGRMEWGPRALGNRSLLADPSRKDFRDRINLHIKRRPAFQPFCPSILAEEKDRLFDASYLNKHMTCAFRLKKEFWGKLPSAIHVDGTARAQFVEEADNPMYYRILKRVKEKTGFGVVINTSFNKHGRTIVESPEDAVRDFLDTDMDYLVIEGFLVTRT